MPLCPIKSAKSQHTYFTKVYLATLSAAVRGVTSRGVWVSHSSDFSNFVRKFKFNEL